MAIQFSIIDEIKKVAEIAQQAKNIPLYEKILDVQAKLLEMQEHILKLETENKELKEKLKVSKNVVYEDNAYWVAENDKKDGPFCSHCYDKDKTLIRMPDRTKTNAYTTCPECKNTFNIRDERPQVAPDWYQE